MLKFFIRCAIINLQFRKRHKGVSLKKRKLLKMLEAKGASYYRDGGNHDVWISKSGKTFPVPRHTEINDYLVRVILKQAEQ